MSEDEHETCPECGNRVGIFITFFRDIEDSSEYRIERHLCGECRTEWFVSEEKLVPTQGEPLWKAPRTTE